MELISVTNKKTLLHKSATDLSVKCINEHSEKRIASSDISFFQSSLTQKCFAQIYKTDILEIWRIKALNDGKEKFDRLRKVKIDGVQAVCCGKSTGKGPEYAIGYTTGQIKVIEFNMESTQKAEFPADPGNKASVISLDYSNCGGYLSSVYENGLINIFGLTTKIKSDSITFDRDSSLARFHPSKRFHLAVASFKGSVTIYDIATKKLHFQQKDAHDAPCRDLAMVENIPDRLLSCGYDSVIKIFDTRKKATGLQVQSYCGLSTISASKCGGYFAVGNLKGDVLSYDMRNLRQPLAKMKVDNEVVTRVTFLPSWDGSSEEFPAMSQRDSTFASFSEDLPEQPEATDEYTMDDIIGFQKGRISELDVSVISRVSTFSTRGRDTNESRMSDNFGQNIANALKDLSFTSDASFQDANSELPELEERKTDQGFKRSSIGKKDSLAIRRSSYLPSPLQRIQEEMDKENLAGSINTISTPTARSVGIPRFSSTPTTVIRKPINTEADDSSEVIVIDSVDTPIKETTVNVEKQTLTETLTAIVVPQIDFRKELEAMQSSIIQTLSEKIHFEVQSHDMDMNRRHLEMQSYNYNLKRHLFERVQLIEESVGLLMNDDFKINRIMELQEENRQLRQLLDDNTGRSN